MRLITCLMMLVWLSLASCQSQNSTNSKEEAPYMVALDSLEQHLRSIGDVQKDTLAAAKYVELVGFKVSNTSKDTVDAYRLVRASKVLRALGEHNRAIQTCDQVISKYATTEAAAEAIFLQGFICDSDLRDTLRARTYYESFLATYPQHPYKGQVEQLLQVLKEDPNTLAKKYMEKGE